MDSIYKSNAEHLAELHKLRKEQSVEKVSKAIDRIIDENKPLTVSRVAQYANISSSTLYNNKDAMDIYNRKCQMYHYNKDVITVKEFIKNNPLCTNKELALNCNINEHKIRNILNTDPDIKPRHERIISNAIEIITDSFDNNKKITISKLSKITGISEGTYIKYGINGAIYNIVLDRVTRYRRKGMSAKQISEIMGYDISTIYKYINILKQQKVLY